MNLKYFFLFLFSSVFCYSQNYTRVDSLVGFYPSNFSKIDDLVFKINSDFPTQSDKARAVFYWICKNVSYDVEFSNKIESQNIQAFSYKTTADFIQKEKKFNSDLALATLKSKTAVCYGYSALFNEIVNKLGFECKLVRGNLKCDPSQIGKKLETNHGWNVVKIDNQWRFVDCTLAAGNISSKTGQFVFDYNDVYFFTEPELFFLNHFPDDEKWLLLDKKTKLDYINLPLYFVNFLNDKTKIGLPQKGMFLENNTFEIKLSDFNIEKNYIAYMFSDEGKRSYVDLDLKPLSYTISLENKANQSLFIFVNKKLLAVYKISK